MEILILMFSDENIILLIEGDYGPVKNILILFQIFLFMFSDENIILLKEGDYGPIEKCFDCCHPRLLYKIVG